MRQSNQRDTGDTAKPPAQVILSIHSENTSENEEAQELGRRLREELLALNEVESIRPKQSAMAHGGKGVAMDWQTVFITLAASGGVMTTLIKAVQAVLARRSVPASITLEMNGDKLVISSASPKNQERLVNDWIRRHN